jgi:hypothetical protein
MRKIAVAGVASILLFGASFSSFAADLAKFSQIAKDTMSQVSGGSVADVDKLIAMQEELITIGKSAIKEYVGAHPKSAKMLNLVSENATKMTKMSLAEIEKEWHEKGFLKGQGIRTDQLEEKSVTGSLMDTIVHPATAIIALRSYKTSKDKALLQQVHDELEEVVHHVEMIKM